VIVIRSEPAHALRWSEWQCMALASNYHAFFNIVIVLAEHELEKTFNFKRCRFILPVYSLHSFFIVVDYIYI
jgi:hypothetical protein